MLYTGYSLFRSLRTGLGTTNTALTPRVRERENAKIARAYSSELHLNGLSGWLVQAAATLVIWGILYYVVPIFASMYAGFGAELPAMTRTIMHISDLVKNTIWYVIGGGLVFLGVSAFLLSRHAVRIATGRLLFRTPVVGKILGTLAAMRFSRTLGTMLVGGVDILRSLDIASRTTGFAFVEQAPSQLHDQLA